ncbi:MAG: response regulator transcription factor [Armatimonadetes bacterium]|nr:response regulator transcription factor [Armatimonadota bacterium]
MKPIRIIIVDDHAMVREGLRTMLRHQETLQIVDEAETGANGIEAVGKHRPDVVLLDIRLPDMSGLEVCRKIHDQFPEVNPVMLTVYEDEHYVFEALRAGARGYLLKKVSDDELTLALRSVCAGEVIVDPSLAGQMALRTAQAGASSGLAVRLTEREHEVLVAMGEGMANNAIARHLHISEETVKTHVKAVLRKLGASDRTQAVSLALRAGIIR